ncbi:MAG: DNA replication/repair protein RecF [Alphaproteobacteria bacterium]|nr:MAG: DNA replication/repair protein RecF [Alphaproteobacteria bacterium]
MPDGPGVGGVFVSSLTLTDFRSYARMRMTPDCNHPLVVLTGENGAGKTNVLEALSYLAPGRGLRRAGLGEVTRLDADGPWAVAASLQVAGDEVKVGTGLDPDGRPDGREVGGRRLVRLDGNAVANSNVLGERWSVVWLTPQMDRLFIEGASSRRRFLDRLVLGLYPDHSRQVGAYERVMRERNRLLSDKGPGADRAWLAALEARMAEHAVAVAVARLDFAGQLAGQLAEAAEGPFPRAELALDGWLEQVLADGTPASDAEAALKEKLAAARKRDAAAGRATGGVHKTDLVVTHAPKAMRADLCSTGEQKALLIALILANARLQAALRRQAPLLLMDEVAAHLDTDRRSALFEALAGLGGQCWLTGTDRALFQGLEGRAEFFDVADGHVRPSHG